MVVLVVGATGTVGTYAVESLLAVSLKVRVLARSKASAYAKFGDAVEIVEGDYDDIGKAVVGVEKVLLITPSTPEQPIIEEKIAVAAKHAGVTLLVKV